MFLVMSLLMNLKYSLPEVCHQYLVEEMRKIRVRGKTKEHKARVGKVDVISMMKPFCKKA